MRSDEGVTALRLAESLRLSIGIKSRFLDNRVQLNVEGFCYKYNNCQATQRVPDPVVPGGFQSPYANIRRSRIYGANIDLNAQVIKNGTFKVGLSLRGYDLPFSPKVTLNLGYEQIIPLGNDARLVGNVGTHHESGKYLDYTRSAACPGRHPAFWKTDVSLTYKAPGDRWTLSVWGRNLENSATYSAFTPAQLKSAGTVIGSYANVYIDSPRTYGARVGVSF
jgi:iron complex outermembrane receptor protein